MKLLVRNLNRATTENEIRVLFAEYGSVGECTLVLDKETGMSKGFGFIEMADEAEAKAALKALNLKEIDDKKIRVKLADS